MAVVRLLLFGFRAALPARAHTHAFSGLLAEVLREGPCYWALVVVLSEILLKQLWYVLR